MTFQGHPVTFTIQTFSSAYCSGPQLSEPFHIEHVEWGGRVIYNLLVTLPIIMYDYVHLCTLNLNTILSLYGHNHAL